MKNKKINLIILFSALALVLYYTLKDDFQSIISHLLKVNIYILLIAIIVFLISLLFKAASLRLFINEHEKDYSLGKTYSLTLIGQFLNGVTPFQSGGQPFQIYLLKKDGVRITDSTNAMLKDFIAFQSALIIMGLFAFITNIWLNVLSENNSLNFLIFIGFLINLFVFLILVSIITAKKTGIKVMKRIIDILFKIRYLKKFSDAKDKLKNSIDRFYKNGTELKKSIKFIVKGTFYNVIHLTLLYLIPMIVFNSLGIYKVSALESIVATSFVMLIGNFIPIPGATGGIEYGFMQFFGSFIGGAILSSGMLLWRFITYLFGMILGFVMLILKKGVRTK